MACTVLFLGAVQGRYGASASLGHLPLCHMGTASISQKCRYNATFPVRGADRLTCVQAANL